MTVRLFANEREAWDVTWGPEQAATRDSFERTFRRMFPGGHRESIRQLIEQCADPEKLASVHEHPNARWLLDVHPRAFDFLSRYGHDYRPFCWKRWPEFGIGHPESSQCFKNSRRLLHVYEHWRTGRDASLAGKLLTHGEGVYVEGITIGAISSPMHHAWNGIRVDGRIAFDWTHAAAARWDRYFGFPVTVAEYQTAVKIISPGKPRYISLFNKKMFSLLESFLSDLAEKRNTKKKEAA